MSVESTSAIKIHVWKVQIFMVLCIRVDGEVRVLSALCVTVHNVSISPVKLKFTRSG